MTEQTQSAFTLLVQAAQQARLTAAEHAAVVQAAQQVQAALTAPATVPPAAGETPTP